MCPECVRTFNEQATTKCRFAGTLVKPSDGLEPSPPSLPCAPNGKRSQRTATVFACFGRFRPLRICDQLPAFAPRGLHKGSTICSHPRQQSPPIPRAGTLLCLRGGHRVSL